MTLYGARRAHHMDGLLTELASVVVDELIALKNMGMKPADIEQLYTQEIPAMPVVPARKHYLHGPPKP